ncbi:MAG: hypothetical protein V3U95_09385 [Dehalococcoidia bacterium]
MDTDNQSGPASMVKLQLRKAECDVAWQRLWEWLLLALEEPLPDVRIHERPAKAGGEAERDRNDS